MRKLTVVWLTALLALGIIFAGYVEVNVLFEQRPALVAVDSPQSVSSLPHSSALYTNSLPVVPGIIISSLLSNCADGPGWIQPNDCQRQIQSIGYARHGGAPLGTAHGCRVSQQAPKLAIPMSSLESLSSLSPPGLILRL